MKNNIYKTDHQDIIELLKGGYNVFRSNNPKLLLRMENKIIYQFNKDKKGNEINKEEWKVTQADFLSDNWSYIDDYQSNYIHETQDFEFLNKFCVDNNVNFSDDEFKYENYFHHLLYEKRIIKNIDKFSFVNDGGFELANFNNSTNAYNFNEYLYIANDSDSGFSDFIENNSYFIILLFKYFINKI